MSVRMSNLENDRDERDDDGPEDRGISEWPRHLRPRRASGRLSCVKISDAFTQQDSFYPPFLLGGSKSLCFVLGNLQRIQSVLCSIKDI